MTSSAVQQAIIRAAREDGIDPSLALAIAQRESSFDPTARNSKTIRGLFQMRGDHRQNFGIGDSDDPYTQTKGWNRFIQGEREAMKRSGYEPKSDADLYAAHHFGAGRAARMFKMDPNEPVDSVFTAREMAENPHFARAGTVGGLLGSVTKDIQKRQRAFGGSTDLPDLASFGELADNSIGSGNPAFGAAKPQKPNQNGELSRDPVAPDLSSFGTLANAEPASSQPAASMAPAPSQQSAGPMPAPSSTLPDLSSFGTPA